MRFIKFVIDKVSLSIFRGTYIVLLFNLLLFFYLGGSIDPYLVSLCRFFSGEEAKITESIFDL